MFTRFKQLHQLPSTWRPNLNKGRSYPHVNEDNIMKTQRTILSLISWDSFLMRHLGDQRMWHIRDETLVWRKDVSGPRLHGQWLTEQGLAISSSSSQSIEHTALGVTPTERQSLPPWDEVHAWVRVGLERKKLALLCESWEISNW